MYNCQGLGKEEEDKKFDSTVCSDRANVLLDPIVDKIPGKRILILFYAVRVYELRRPQNGPGVKLDCFFFLITWF